MLSWTVPGAHCCVSAAVESGQGRSASCGVGCKAGDQSPLPLAPSPSCLQIYSRTRDGFSLVEERPEMPSLREVSLEVLPKAAAAKAKAAAAARG